MNVKAFCQMFAQFSSAQLSEISEITTGMKGRDKRDAAEEAKLQDFIASLPGPPDDGSATLLKQGRAAAGRCCACGKAKEEIPA